MRRTALLALAACAVPLLPPLASSSRQEPTLNLPKPTGPLVLPPVPAGRSSSEVERYTYRDLLHDFSTLTGQKFLYDQETGGYLMSAEVGITHGAQVGPERAQQVFESILASADFLLTILSHEDPCILEVTSLQTGQRNKVRSSAIFVPIEELEEMARHPALLVTTVLHLEKADARQLSNSMRTMITDANTEGILPAGTNSMVLTGTGERVAGFARLLRAIDEHASPPPADDAHEDGDDG